MKYLTSIAFIIVFSLGNIVNWIWKNHMNKVFWSTISALWIYNFYNWGKDPSGTWERFTTNIQNPWYYIPISLSILIPIVFLIIMKIMKKKVDKETIAFLKEMKKGIAKSCIETALMRGDTLPNDEDINKYYKMYCIKFEMDNRDQWTTLEPMPFEKFEKEAKIPPETIEIPLDDQLSEHDKKEIGEDSKRILYIRKRGGWEFLISMTSDMFSFDPISGQSTMTRFRDYEKMI